MAHGEDTRIISSPQAALPAQGAENPRPLGIIRDSALCRLCRARHKRHSFATAYLENGAAITDLQGLLGHQSITTTQIYAAMVDKRARASLEALQFGA